MMSNSLCLSHLFFRTEMIYSAFLCTDWIYKKGEVGYRFGHSG